MRYICLVFAYNGRLSSLNKDGHSSACAQKVSYEWHVLLAQQSIEPALWIELHDGVTSALDLAREQVQRDRKSLTLDLTYVHALLDMELTLDHVQLLHAM